VGLLLQLLLLLLLLLLLRLATLAPGLPVLRVQGLPVVLVQGLPVVLMLVQGLPVVLVKFLLPPESMLANPSLLPCLVLPLVVGAAEVHE
jgi:hypothetical protein